MSPLKALLFCIPTRNELFHSLASIWCFNFGHSDRYVVISYWCFNLHFFYIWCGVTFLYVYLSSAYLFWWDTCHGLIRDFLFRLFVFLFVNVKSSSYILDNNPFSDMCSTSISFPSLWRVFSFSWQCLSQSRKL